MRLQDIMETVVDTVEQTASAEAAWAKMRLRGCHHLVVMRGSDIVGVISARDLGGTAGAALRRNRTVDPLMTPGAVTAAPDTTIRQAANLMRGRSIGSLPIVERGKLVGIVTVSDLLELIGKGAERPMVRRQRATLATRGPRRKPVVPQSFR